ncbi:MAG: hypothetical protein IT435_12950 [Phycisphaerales bacterium]|nr:hypothetical protein [Phycisphaerales bacterium]
MARITGSRNHLALRMAGMLALTAGTCLTVRADIITWLLATNGNWSNPAMWSDSNVPNDLNDVALIDKTGGNYTINVDFDVPVEALTLDSPDATINLNGSRWMYVAAVHPDSFCHVRQGNFYVQGGATLKSDRKISISEPNARIYLNNGALEGGELEINDGGMMQTNGIGYIRTAASYLGTPGDTAINILDGTTLIFDHDGHVLDGDGMVRMNSSYYGANVELRGDVLNGAVFDLSNHGGNVIYAQAAADPDWQFANYNTVQGSGHLGNNTTALFNGLNAVISANNAGGSLLVDPGADPMSNSGTMMATNTGTLYLQGGTYETSHPGTATIFADNASRVILNTNAVVKGQVLATIGTGVIDLFESTLTDTIGPYPTHITGWVRILDGHTGSFNGNFDLTGLVQMTSSYYGSTLNLTGDASLYGAGVLSMSNHGGNYIQSIPAHTNTLHNFDCTIVGSGQLGSNTAGVYNYTGGDIQAQGSTGLVINPSDALGARNEGLMRALAGGYLYLDGPGFDNTDGTIRADANGVVLLRTANITGGQFTSAGNGYFTQAGNSHAVLTNVTSHAPVYIPDGHTLRFQTAFTNTNILTMQSSYYGSTFLVQGGDLSLSGGGTISLSNHGGNYIYGVTGDLKLTNEDNLIAGSGNLGYNQLTLVNNATFRAVGSSGLVVNPTDAGGCDNNNLMEAAPGGRLYLDGAGFNNVDGTIHAADTGIVFFRTASITGGQLTADGSGYFTQAGNSNAVLTDVTSHAPVYIPDAHTVRFQNTFVNTDILTMQSSYYGTTFFVQNGDLTLSGGGTISLSNHGANYVYAATGDLKLINQDNLITGSGNFGYNQLTIVNNDTIQAAGNSGLVVNPNDAGGVDNNALMEASPGGRLYLDGPGFDNTDGTIHAADDGIVFLRTAGITGGQLTADGSGYFTQAGNSNAVLTGVTSNAPFYIPDAHTVRFNNTFTNNNAVIMQSSYYGTTFLLDSNTTLTGNGVITLSNHGSNYIYGANGNIVLTNNGNTINGCGNIGHNQLVIVNGPTGKIISDVSGGMNINPSNTGGFTNQGLLHVVGTGIVNLNDGPFTTSGTVIVDAARKLDRTAGDFIQTGGATFANGEIEVDNNNYLLQGGSLGGTGLVDSNVINSAGALAPGNSPGALTIEGNYTQEAGGEMTIEIGGKNPGEFDKLAITGNATLAGVLRLSNFNGYFAEHGEQVTILTTTGSLNGEFDQVIQPISGPRWGVTYLTKSIVLTAHCGSDFDGSGFVDLDDFITFVAAFEEGTDNADFDGSGFVDLDDFIAFVIAFESGC